MTLALVARLAACGGGGGGNTIAKRVDNGASQESTCRIVYDAFDALARSMLGRKCGVGGDWNDVESASLREKSVDQTCHDVRASLPTMTKVDYTMPPSKRRITTKAAGESSKCHHTLEEVEHATLWLNTLLRQ